MILELLPEGDPFLKKPVPDFDGDADLRLSVATDLADTMMAHEALGLSANQVGLPYRAFVMRTREGWYRACFNPQIDVLGEITSHGEGCLSFPGLNLTIKRPSTVFMQWWDQNGDHHSEMMSGYDAYCAQHELDHLNGITFDTHVSKLSLDIAKRKRAKKR